MKKLLLITPLFFLRCQPVSSGDLYYGKDTVVVLSNKRVTKCKVVQVRSGRYIIPMDTMIEGAWDVNFMVTDKGTLEPLE